MVIELDRYDFLGLVQRIFISDKELWFQYC